MSHEGLKSASARLFVQQLAHTDSKENIKSPYYMPFVCVCWVGGIHCLMETESILDFHVMT